MDEFKKECPVDSPLPYAKFEHPEITAKGETRAHVALTQLETLWFNTGSLCNLSCQGCYMDSAQQMIGWLISQRVMLKHFSMKS